MWIKVELTQVWVTEHNLKLAAYPGFKFLDTTTITTTSIIQDCRILKLAKSN